ncbi:MAG: SH3 domain-containing protein [Clostridiaceae bacterium]|nr:SH3 domain-containing protein [Clostridiaceae bacterium]
MPNACLTHRQRRKYGRLLVLTLIIISVLSQTGLFAMPDTLIQAETETPINRTGVVTTQVANVRQTPNTSLPKLTTVYSAQQLDVLSVTTGLYVSGYGDQWYKIHFVQAGKEYTGYIVAGFVRLTSSQVAYVQNPDFEAYLTAQGFPESYKEPLRRIHAQHPNWVFEARHTDLTWSEVLAGEESIPNNNVIPTSFADGYKSTKVYEDKPLIYNWETNQWALYDAAWNMCNQEYLAYFMDPRNFLDPVNIFQFELLSFDPSIHTKEGTEKILAGSFMGNKAFNYVDAATNETRSMLFSEAFMKAASTDYSGVSPYHLASRSRIEVGSNGSPSVSGTFSADLVAAYAARGITYTPDATDLACDGHYNFYNIGAYASNVLLGNVKNGLNYARTNTRLNPYPELNPLYPNNPDAPIPWVDPLRSIIGGSLFIGNSYIKVKQDTLYLQKFDVDKSDGRLYYHQYMGNVLAPFYEALRIYDAYRDMDFLNSAIKFSIPIFKDMPDKTALPDIRNPNNWLKSLIVEGYQLTPGFTAANTGEYDLIVENNVSSINLTGTLVTSLATVSGTGVKQLAVGENIFPVVVTAENGSQRTYTVSITRRGDPSTQPTPTPSPPPEDLTANTLIIKDTTICGLNPVDGINTVESIMADLITPAGCEAVLLDAQGNPWQGLVGTGGILRIIRNNETIKEYTVMLYGDANGDGEINAIDYAAITRHLLNKTPLNEPKLSTADANRDNEINAIDLAAIVRHVFRKFTIDQS